VQDGKFEYFCFYYKGQYKSFIAAHKEGEGFAMSVECPNFVCKNSSVLAQRV
jgi:hypothetical protein